MAPRTEEQNEEIRQQSRKKILGAALHAFALKGFAQCSMEYIAKKAGISKGLAYNYFSSKDTLLEEVMLDGFKTIEQLLAKAFVPDPLQTLINMLDVFFESFEKDKEFWTIYIRVGTQPEIMDKMKNFHESKSDEIIQSMTHLFKQLGAEDPEAEAFVFSAYFEGVINACTMSYTDYPLTRVKNLIIKRYTNLFGKK